MNVDKENLISVLDNFHAQCSRASSLGEDVKVAQPVDSIILCGMGGSALAGDIVKSCVNVRIPIVVNRDYSIPSFATKNSLVFILSYSGNTEESISCYKEAKKSYAKIVILSSNGKLADLALQDKTQCIRIPSGIQPRHALGYLTFSILNVLSNSKIIHKDDAAISSVVAALKKDYHETAKDLAQKLAGKIPIIYSSARLEVLARVWKANINENAKVQAFYNVFPELNHNEMVGFTNLKGNYYIIIIEDIGDSPRIKKRMEITKKLLQEKGCSVLILKLTGESLLARIFSSILLAAYTGYYLALEYKVDPTPVEMVEKFKKLLKE